MKCVKFLLFLFNFIFWVCGLALIVVGCLVQVALRNTLVIKDAAASSAPLVIIGVGVVIFFIAFFGCCGAWKESHCMVATFAVLLSFIIIIEVAAAIAGYVFRGKVTGLVQDSLQDMIRQYKNNTDIQKTVDKVQQDLKCCGINSTADWPNFGPAANSVPDSCCVNVTAGCGQGTMTDPNVVYQQGCQKAVEDLLKKNLLWVIVAALVIAFLQIMGIVFACMLMRGIRSGYEVM